MTCREVDMEIAKVEAFLLDVRTTRNGFNGAHVLGFLGDFGIGNSIEGSEAEKSGADRLAALQAIKPVKCNRRR